MRLAFIVILAALLASCSGNKPKPDCDSVHVAPVYRYFTTSHCPDSDSIALYAFMRTVSEQPPSAELLDTWASSQAVEVFTPDVDSVFTDTSYVSRSLGCILAQARKDGIRFPDRRYATVVYGRPESILFVDSVMLIALNHYLGAEYPGYSHWPVYMRQGKTPEAMPYDIAEALVGTSYPYMLKGDDATALSRMVYEGALAYVKMRLVPESDLAGVLGYTDAQLRWLRENEQAIWHSIVQRQLLYDTSASTIDRLVAPAPEVSIVSPSTPGRVGRYIGYRIVEEYIKRNPGATPAAMLEPAFYKGNAVLINSEYLAR